jgi:hypothetical protein
MKGTASAVPYTSFKRGRLYRLLKKPAVSEHDFRDSENSALYQGTTLVVPQA